MQVVILAGGKGARLRPYTAVLPKPLMPIGDMPILEVVLLQLKHAGFTEIIMAVGHLASLIETYFGDGSQWELKIRYSREREPLGTAGPIALIEGLRSPFLVMNGDVLTNLDYRKFMAYHQQEGGVATIAMYNKAVDITLGVIEADEKNDIYNYIEKPTLYYQVSMGIYAFGERVLRYIEPGKYLDFPDLIKLLLANGEQVKGYPFAGDWLDIGRKEDYEQAIEIFEDSCAKFLP
jgi:NDP-sugar pyrophosphorylase family protein